MNEKFRLTECEFINNQYGLHFHKLVINDCCLFDEFYEDVWRSIKGKKTLSSIIARMENFGDNLLPKKYFRQIKELGRSDIFEFKQNDVRIYVQMVKPDVVIILGGYKNNQKKDIRRIQRIVSNL